jgi:hypothetical protein
MSLYHSAWEPHKFPGGLPIYSLTPTIIFIIFIAMTIKHKYTADESAALATLEQRLNHIRDAVRGVVKGYQTALFLSGEGGTSKSYTVTQTLQELKCKYVLHNSRLTARGLVDALESQPTCIHMIEDAETMMADKNTPGVLRSACWSQSKKLPMEREITWTAFKTVIRFTFTGGLIVISNANLADNVPEIRAMETRINSLRMDVSAEEIKALMTKICFDGYRFGEYFMDVDQCLEVRDHIIKRLAELKRGLDLRVMMNGFKFYLQWQNGESTNHWHQLLEGFMAKRVMVGGYKDRRTTNAENTQIALAIDAMKLSWVEKVKMFKEKTGRAGAASFDRARKRKL